MGKINTFSIGFLLLLLLGTACSEEKLIEETNSDIALSVTIATNLGNTKAEGDNVIATTEELQINNYTISVFAKEDGSEITDKTDTRLDYKTGNVDEGQSSCTINGVKAQVGKVHIVAVANAEANTSYESYNHYVGLKAATVTAEPGQLIKVGTAVPDITKNNETVKVELTQLAAKVDFQVKVEPEDGAGWVYEIKDIQVYNVNMKSDLVIERYNMQRVLKDLSFPGNQKKISFYTYERKPDDTDPIKIKVNGILKDGNDESVQIEKSYSLTLNPKKTDDGSVKGDGVLHGSRYDVTGTIRPKSAFVMEWKILEKEEIPVIVPDFE